MSITSTSSIPSTMSTPSIPPARAVGAVAAAGSAPARALGWITLPSAFGPLLLGFTRRGLAALGMVSGVGPGADADAARAELVLAAPGVEWADNPAALAATRAWLAAYAEGAGEHGGLDAAAAHRAAAAPVAPPPPLDLVGTEFQMQVWAELLRIPVGETRDYGQIAAAAGRPKAARAAGSAIGANPVAIIVPCHRVVRRGGGLGGFRWGTAVKEQLLAREIAGARR